MRPAVIISIMIVVGWIWVADLALVGVMFRDGMRGLAAYILFMSTVSTVLLLKSVAVLRKEAENATTKP